MTARACPLPSTSRLASYVGEGDFLDCYAVRSDLSVHDAAEVITSFPGWVNDLLTVRWAVTAPFGLKNGLPDTENRVGPFPVEHDDESEIIAGFNDRHLDFRVSILAKDGQVHLATWVHPNNVGGRLYLATIMPFHILVARNALARVAAHAEKPVYPQKNPS